MTKGITHVVAASVLLTGSLTCISNAAQRGRTVEATLANGHYRHANVMFDVPSDWKYEGTVTGNGSSDATAQWTDPQSGINLFVYLDDARVAPESLASLVGNAITHQTEKRTRQGYLKWRVPADGTQQTSIGGHQALIAVANFERKSGVQRREWLAWIFSPANRVVFFAAMAPNQVTSLRPELEKIARSTNLQ